MDWEQVKEGIRTPINGPGGYSTKSRAIQMNRSSTSRSDGYGGDKNEGEKEGRKERRKVVDEMKKNEIASDLEWSGR